MPQLLLKQLAYQHHGPFDLTIAPSECVTLSGASGSGKTLLLRAIADLDPHQGEVCLGTQCCQTMPAHQWRQRIGLLPAETHWWCETVGAHFPQWSDTLVQTLGFLPDVATWSIHRLSSGERQRLGLARILAMQPKALLLDEPTANLDAQNVEKIEQVLDDYRRQHQVPVLWVSHDAAQCLRVAQRHLHLQEGQLQVQRLSVQAS